VLTSSAAGAQVPIDVLSGRQSKWEKREAIKMDRIEVEIDTRK
jgi:hypothetical protein